MDVKNEGTHKKPSNFETSEHVESKSCLKQNGGDEFLASIITFLTCNKGKGGGKRLGINYCYGNNKDDTTLSSQRSIYYSRLTGGGRRVKAGREAELT